MLEDKTPSDSLTPAWTPRHSNVMESSLCFVWDTRQENEDAHYNNGGKGRCSLDSSKSKLIEAQKIHILNESSHFYTAANCFKGARSGSAHDIFTADVLYHKSCYNKFIYILLQQKRKRQQQQEEKDQKNKNEEVIRRFCRLIEQKMLNDKKAFLLIDLLGDISDLSDEEGIEPVATSTNLWEEYLKQTLKKWFLFGLLGNSYWYAPRMSIHPFMLLQHWKDVGFVMMI